MQRLTDTQLSEIAQIALDFHADEPRIDWERLLDRAESHLDIDLGDDMTDPEIERIKRYVRKARRDASTLEEQ